MHFDTIRKRFAIHHIECGVSCQLLAIISRCPPFDHDRVAVYMNAQSADDSAGPSSNDSFNAFLNQFARVNFGLQTHSNSSMRSDHHRIQYLCSNNGSRAKITAACRHWFDHHPNSRLRGWN